MTKPELVTTTWRITKADTDAAGVMRWKATTTKFSFDVQGDMVTPQFYLKARQRMLNKVVPQPFFSVAHYPLENECLKCGHVYKSMMDYNCPDCHRERLIAGVATSLWIDGKMPKAEGIFHPTRLGKAMYAACEEDIRKSRPEAERVRISMGFYPDLDGVEYPAPGKRVFTSGWVEHLAGTRVPVVPEAAVEDVAITKSAAIRTRYDDGASMIDKALVDELRVLDSRRAQRKSGAEAVLVFKSDAPVKQSPDEDAVDAEATTAADEVGNLAIAAKAEEDQKVKDANADSGRQIKSDTLDKLDLITATGETIAAISEVVTQVHSTDPLIMETKSTLRSIQKALVAAPGNQKAEILARAANLIRAIRDYAHTLVDQPSPVPPSPIPPQTLPENAPMPPVGSVTDKTTELQDLQAAEDEQAAEEGLAEPGEEVAPDDADSAELMVDGVAPTDDEEAAIDAESAAAEDEMAAGEDEEAADEEELADDQEVADALTEEADTGEAAEEGAEEADEETPGDLQESTDAEEEAADTEEAEEVPPVEPLKEGVPGKIKVPTPPTNPDEKKKKNPFAKSTANNDTPAGQRVKARAKPNAAVKSAAKHPAEAYLTLWSDTVTKVVKDPALTRGEKRERVEKAMQLFSEQMAGIIDAATPVTQKDLTEVVSAEVQKALAIKDAQHAATVEALQQQIAELQTGQPQAGSSRMSISKSAVEAAIQQALIGKGSGKRAQRRSLASLQPQATVSKSDTNVASSGSDAIKGVSARDAARLSVAKSQVTPYF